VCWWENNSFVIAAACQRPEKDEGAELRGAVRHETGEGEPGHCCFTSEEGRGQGCGICIYD
jgi:hypothetical protein